MFFSLYIFGLYDLAYKFQKLLEQRHRAVLDTNYHRKEKLTERIPHPVGTKAKMLANTSVIERSVNTTAMAIPASAIKKEMP